MQFLGADAYFGSETKLGAVGIRRGRIDIHTGCINEAAETASGCFIIDDNAFAVSRPIS